MDNNERDIRRFLETEAERAPKPTSIAAATVRRARHKRVGLLISAILGVTVLTASVAVGVTALRDDEPRISPADPDQTPTPDEASRTHSDDKLGLTITTPAEWTVEMPEGVQSTVLRGGNFAFDSSRGFCTKGDPLTTLPVHGVFFWMYEFDSPDATPRPQSFTLEEESFNPYEGSGCILTYRIKFSDSSRNFVIHVAFGAEVSDTLRGEVLDALDSIEVQPDP
ncbi:MAG TPA: hypothetical protein VEV82_02705 [Actinomycetota bacterium]|nr:hypothetical protein [Actinomycetota bacterium]